MTKSITKEIINKITQRYYAAKDLRITIALISMAALLGGAFLQFLSAYLAAHMGYSTASVSILLVIGYVLIIAILSLFFCHRFIGPFSRLEYEMKLIAGGELDRRLTVRAKDDFHIRNFVNYVNRFISNFSGMSRDYSELHSALSVRINDIRSKLETGECRPEEIKQMLDNLQAQIRDLRAKW